MDTLVNFAWRLALKIAYPLARCYWSWFKRDVRGTFVFVRHQGRILLIRNSYRPALNAPGGMVKAGEAAVDTAVRELQEEVGIAVQPGLLKPLGPAPKRDPEGFGTAEMFEVELTEEPEVTIDHREVVWAAFLPLEAALSERLDFAVRKYLERER